MALILEPTRVLLQSDDSLWYWLELIEEEGVVLPYSDGVAVSPPGGADAFAILDNADDSNTYRLSLATSGTDVTPLLTISPGPEVGLPELPLQLDSVDYILTVRDDDTGEPELQVDLGGCIPAQVTADPTDQSYTQGDTFRLRVTAIGTIPLTYQWRKDGVDIPGATSSQLPFILAEPSDSGSYQVVVSNGCGSDVSGSATVTVSALVPQPVVAMGGGGGHIVSMSVPPMNQEVSLKKEVRAFFGLSD